MPNGHTDPPLSPRCTGPLTHGPSSTSRTSRGVRGCLSGAWVAPVRVGDMPTTKARYPPPHDNLQAAAMAACEVCCRIRWTRANDALDDLPAASLLQVMAEQVMANAFATRTAMQREHVEQPEHGENGADEQRLTPCLAISGAQRVEKSAISNLFIDFFCISIPCPGLSTPRTPPTRPHRDTSTDH